MLIHKKSQLKFSSVVEALLLLNGVIIQRVVGSNLVVNNGRDLALTQIAGTTTTPATYLALGSSNSVAVATQTVLIAEAPGGVRKNATLTLSSPGSMLYSALWLEAENQNTTVNEVGIFTALTGGTMFARFVLPSPITKDQYSQLQINWTLNAAAS